MVENVYYVGSHVQTPQVMRSRGAIVVAQVYVDRHVLSAKNFDLAALSQQVSFKAAGRHV